MKRASPKRAMRRNHMSKPNVLHVVYSLGVGGAEIYLASMAAAGLELELFDSGVMGWQKSGPLKERLEASGVSVYPPLNRSKLPLFLQLNSLAAQIAKTATDMGATHIHGHLNDGGLLAVMAGKKAGLPSLAHVHSNHILPVSLSSVKRQIWTRAATWTYNNAASILTISDEVEDTVRERFGTPERILRRAPIGVAAPKPTLDRAHIRAQLDIGDEANLLVFVGRLVSNKNQKALIKMMPELLKHQPGAELMLVGDGPDMQDLTKLVSQNQLNSVVHLLGRRHDVANLLLASDAFVTASETEGVSLAILEAFASNLPVISVAVPGNTELVGNERGWLAATDEPASLAEQIHLCLTEKDHTRKKTKAAFNYWAANNSLESAARALSSIYEDTASFAL